MRILFASIVIGPLMLFGALPAAADAITQGHTVGLNEVEEVLQLIDDHRADRLQRSIECRLPAKNIRLVGVHRTAVYSGRDIAVLGRKRSVGVEFICGRARNQARGLVTRPKSVGSRA